MIFSKSKQCHALKSSLDANTNLKRKLSALQRNNTVMSLLPEESSSCVKSVCVAPPTAAQDCTSTDKLSSFMRFETPSRHKATPTPQRLFSSTKIVLTGPSAVQRDMELTARITRELVIEHLLSLIDLPVVEHLLQIDEQNHLEDLFVAADLVRRSVPVSRSTQDTPKSSSLSSNNTLHILTETYDLSRCVK